MSTPATDFPIGVARRDDIPRAGRLLLTLLSRLEAGTLTFTAPGGTTTTFRGAHPSPVADIAFLDWGVATEAIRSAEIGLAECYRDGRLHTHDLTAFLTLCAANQSALERVFYGRPLVALWLRFKHFLRSNTRANSKKNIHAHYDLSNDFYALWLDGTMSYSSALFEGDAGRSMEAAQTAKYERILQMLDPKPGERILEIGCGWGGFAEHAARTRGVRVHGITLSRAQLAFAQARMARAGLSGLVDLQYVDYRDVQGQYDAIVSIEMFEAVGERYWPTYFRTVHDRLKSGGRAVIQAITIDEAAFARYRATSDFIREYIFPGGMLAPPSRFVHDARAAGLVAGAPHRFGADYAATLAWWRERVNAAAQPIRALGFDEQFLQLWRFYLCYCEAGFRSGRTDVMQIELAKP
ncbi:MAG: class I SAM-dependent methyltransferase [Betaproteobacteria bacterium]|nr:class I SAM-dependent methyltransferase [Betaproteobacteria bacterium]